jgi:hypothetical protein
MILQCHKTKKVPCLKKSKDIGNPYVISDARLNFVLEGENTVKDIIEFIDKIGYRC